MLQFVSTIRGNGLVRLSFYRELTEAYKHIIYTPINHIDCNSNTYRISDTDDRGAVAG
jgi:hypothetical protein